MNDIVKLRTVNVSAKIVTCQLITVVKNDRKFKRQETTNQLQSILLSIQLAKFLEGLFIHVKAPKLIQGRATEVAESWCHFLGLLLPLL